MSALFVSDYIFAIFELNTNQLRLYILHILYVCRYLDVIQALSLKYFSALIKFYQKDIGM